MISKETLLAEAAAAGFRPETLEKALLLISLLDSFNRHPFLKKRLALKGGTALNLFVFNVPRLSVDIDLNYVGAPDKDTMLKERDDLAQAARSVCEREGMTIVSHPPFTHEYENACHVCYNPAEGRRVQPR